MITYTTRNSTYEVDLDAEAVRYVEGQNGPVFPLAPAVTYKPEPFAVPPALCERTVSTPGAYPEHCTEEASDGSDFCPAHDPDFEHDRREEAADARRKGE